MRKNFDRTETKLFRQVLPEGKEKGIFDIDNVNIVADIVHYLSLIHIWIRTIRLYNVGVSGLQSRGDFNIILSFEVTALPGRT